MTWYDPFSWFTSWWPRAAPTPPPIVLPPPVQPPLPPVVTPPPQPPPQPALTEKQPPRGLTSMGREGRWIDDRTINPVNDLRECIAHAGAYSNVVILVAADQIGDGDYSCIDTALARVAAYNLRYPATPLRVKLRIFFGVRAPAGMMALAGGPVMLYAIGDDTSTAPTLAYPKFWTPEYQEAMTALQEKLAARYDNDPLIAAVAITDCSSETAEPFILPLRNPRNAQVLLDAGFTDAEFKVALQLAPSAYEAWQLTPLDFTFNPFRSVSHTSSAFDTQAAISIMQGFRANYGGRAIIANHGLQDPARGDAAAIMDAIKALGGPITFQTMSPTTDIVSAFKVGLSYGMTEFEVFDSTAAGGLCNVSLAELLAMRAQMGA